MIKKVGIWDGKEGSMSGGERGWEVRFLFDFYRNVSIENLSVGVGKGV